MSDALPLLGFGLPVSGGWATPRAMVDVARRAEELGYASLWTFQRLLSPLAVEVTDPAGRGSDDATYRAVHDPLLPLAFVAGHTERIGLGTATICAPFLAPAVLAKATTTLDHLSDGRVTLGLGLGWMPQEYVAAGVPFTRRGARLDEYLRCLEALWTEDPVAFEGEFYSVPPSRPGLLPVQRPRPPVLLGGAAPAALRRAGRLADGWIGSSRPDPRGLESAVAQVREGAREAGRDPDLLRIVVRVVVDLLDDEPGPGRRPFHGTPDQVTADLRSLRERGVTEVALDPNFSSRVGSPAVDADAGMAEATRVLEAFAPSRYQETPAP